MPTLGTVELEASADAAYDALLAACKDAGAKVEQSSAELRAVEGKSGMMWMKNRFPFRFYARIAPGKESGRAVLQVYDFSPVAPDRRFIEVLVKKVGTAVKLAGEVDYETVEDIKSAAGQADAAKKEQDAADAASSAAAPPVPSVAEEGGRRPNQQSPASAAGSAKIVAAHLKLVVDTSSIGTYKYGIKAVEGGGPYAAADRMVVFPIEVGNVIRFFKGDFSLGELPIHSLESIAATTDREKGLLGEKTNRKVTLAYRSDGPEGRPLVSMTLDVEDDKAGAIVDQLASLRKLELEGTYFRYLNLEYRADGSSWAPTVVFYATPFLAPGERVIWSEYGTEGLFSRRYKWLKAVTNFRAIYYDFEAHRADAVMLPGVGDVLVTNKWTETKTERSTDAGYRVRYMGHSRRTTQAKTSRTVYGNVLIMHGGHPFMKLASVKDPDGVAAMIKYAVAESRSNLRAAGKEPGAGQEEPPRAAGLEEASHAGKRRRPPEAAEADHAAAARGSGMVCPRCGSQNAADSIFCNKCGSKLDYKCPRCGRRNATDARFCNQCGSQL